MKRLYIFALLLILLLPVSGWGATSYCGAWGKTEGGASPWYVSSVSGGTASATSADIAACVNEHITAGDTVYVTKTGSVTWTAGITLTQGVLLIGPGKANLTIVGGSGITLITYDPANRALDTPFSLTGFTFYGGMLTNDSQHNSIAFKLSMENAIPQTKIKIYDNNFNNLEEPIYICGGFGVVYNNTFNTVRYLARHSCGWEGGKYSWENWDDVSFGAVDNNIYYEDNTVINSLNSVTEAYYGSRYAFRYNTVGMNANAFPFADAHGNNNPTGDANYYSTMGGEFYGNNVSFSGTYGTGFFQQRGGKFLWFYNSINGSGSFTGGAVREEQWDGESPIAGAYSDRVQHVNNTYIWGNYKNYSTKLSQTYMYAYNCCTGCGTDTVCMQDDDCCYNNTVVGGVVTDPPKLAPLLPDVQYWRDEIGTFDGTTGVGCGTLANRPSTCTTGVGYWATNQSCTDLTGMVGKDVSPDTCIDGTLFKCVSTNTWEAYYRPLTYPHPLRQAAGEAKKCPRTSEPGPVRSGLTNNAPSSCSDTVEFQVSLSTDGAADVCQYCVGNGGTCTDSTAYDNEAMTTFTNTTAMNHSTTLSAACADALKTVYVRCSDGTTANNTSSTTTYNVGGDNDTTKPTLTTATILESNILQLVFSKNIQWGAEGNVGWTLASTYSHTPALAITTCTIAGTTMNCYLNGTVYKDTYETVTISYSVGADGVGGTTDTAPAKNELAAINAGAVTNDSEALPPSDPGADSKPYVGVQSQVVWPEGRTKGENCYEDAEQTTPRQGSPTDTDGESTLVLGTSFTVSKVGRVRGISFYKQEAGVGDEEYVVTLFDKITDEVLATATYTGTATGWVYKAFDTPYPVTTTGDYKVAVYFPTGDWSYTYEYFGCLYPNTNRSKVDGFLTASSGYYTYTATPTAVPTTQSQSKRSYFIEPVFDPPPTIAITGGATIMTTGGPGLILQ